MNARLINEANNLFQDNWPSIYAKDLIPYPQNGTASYHTRSETEQDRVRDFSEVTTIGNCLQWVLAHDFSPGTTAELDSNGKKFKVTVSLEEI